MSKKFILFLSLFFSISIKPQNFVTEIVNNTDKPIILQTGSAGVYSYITKRISLETQQEVKYVKPAEQQGHLILNARTKNFIANLNIPIISPNGPQAHHNADRYKNFHAGYYFHMNFQTYFAKDAEPVPFVGLRMKGGLLEVCEGVGIKSVHFNDEEIPLKFAVHSCLKKVQPNSTLSVEVRQLAKGIAHIQKGKRFVLRDNSLDVVIKTNNLSSISPIIDSDSPPRAYISDVQSNATFQGETGLTIVAVKFDNLKNENYLRKFYSFMREKNLIKALAKVYTEEISSVPHKYEALNITRLNMSADGRMVFIFYGDINIKEFQSLLAQANQALLHL